MVVLIFAAAVLAAVLAVVLAIVAPDAHVNTAEERAILLMGVSLGVVLAGAVGIWRGD